MLMRILTSLAYSVGFAVAIVGYFVSMMKVMTHDDDRVTLAFFIGTLVLIMWILLYAFSV